ncbi:argininosuccinate lyase [Myroides odoratus]|uniref:Argininosuccinate lyase n=1 Tax=Myroides odoratus TaxID=256 RepID=A0A9Q6ZC32_MYROD|nr:argininosuccinate lyase [Myroides odoratus]EHQ42483.1 argininosuccinate lyase [Myroides odoratus DSM 2801]EKB07863.1 argininosuccinate lyase [Myroides odoratus CIP 103059]QQT99855.1 argininosuccinate lyase [Myroides odoratus]WQD57930.1 argininosuccinate lyase [Myroides odoratus]STZ29744.1 Argininosuccinate lyase [Myroides odoratus]
MKLWQKNTTVNQAVDAFTVGQDRILDLNLAPFDVLGSLAHTQMLHHIGLLTEEELALIQNELKVIYQEIIQGEFQIEEEVEDIHSQIELLLTRRIGEAGKKIHAGRSRNDQVLVDLKLYFRHEIEAVVQLVQSVFETFQRLSNQHKAVLIPGYTHLQIAMPSSFGLWFGAYAESLVDDLELMSAAWKVVNKNPLGSAAGYGSSFPLDRQMTTDLLGFQSMNYNVVYAQMGRGKSERILAQGLSSIAATLAKWAMDCCLYMGQNYKFIGFPDHLTTGSSIMPHKKNPDVLELIRSRCNKIQALPNEIALMTTNLPAGYHRDLQLLKENLFPAFTSLKECLEMTQLMLENIEINSDILSDSKYDYLFSVEVVNQLVLNGTPFREAYKTIGLAIEEGEYQPTKEVEHTHQGSIGNLMNEEIKVVFDTVYQTFGFDQVKNKLVRLVL